MLNQNFTYVVGDINLVMCTVNYIFITVKERVVEDMEGEDFLFSGMCWG